MRNSDTRCFHITSKHARRRAAVTRGVAAATERVQKIEK